MAGYSGTPLAAKLGIKPGTMLHVSGAPANYRRLLAPLPENVRFAARLTPATDIVHVFATKRAHLERVLHTSLPQLKPDGVIWVSWPKKASGMPTDITEDIVRAVALPMGLVDVKVCAVDDTWSALKLVIRKALRDQKAGR